MTRKVVGLTGYAQTGKDTVGQILVSHRGYTRFSFADNVREAVLRLNPLIPDPWTNPNYGMYETASVPLKYVVDRVGYEVAKQTIPEVRRLLQVMGTEVGREMFGQDSWIEMVGRQVRATENDVVITDVRFQNEADYVRSLGGIVLRVERPGTGPVNDHVSDRIEFQADGTIHNTGSLQVLTKVVLQLDSIGWSSL